MVDLVLDLDCANAKYPWGGGGKVIHGCAAIGILNGHDKIWYHIKTVLFR